MNTITVEEARKFLGTDGTSLCDIEVERLIIFLENLCNKFIEEVVTQDVKRTN
ncbi:hypothetical protein KAZ57_02280 [Patescibacteria group bacterium]|nr:hypothetical protein [Patescibacteria group bacterium]